MTPPDPKTPAGEALSDARAREVLQTVRGSALWLTDADAVAAMLAFAKEATPPAIDAPASGAGATFEVDDRGLFCRHCGRSSVRHHRVNGVGNFCEPAAAPKAASEAAGLRDRIAQAVYRAAPDTSPRDKHRSVAWDYASESSRARAFAVADDALTHPSPIEIATRADHAQGGGEVAFGHCKDCPGAHSLMCCAQSSSGENFLTNTPGCDLLEQADIVDVVLPIIVRNTPSVGRSAHHVACEVADAVFRALSPARDGAGS